MTERPGGEKIAFMNEATKKWIDDASYETLLAKWRYAPSGDPMFQGENGDYYQRVMNEKGAGLTNEEKSRASKNIGWD